MNSGSELDILLITGQSGAGKSVGLRTLEDSGFYCVDNIPAGLLADLVLRIGRDVGAPLAIGVDTRSAVAEGGGLGGLPGQTVGGRRGCGCHGEKPLGLCFGFNSW